MDELYWTWQMKILKIMGAGLNEKNQIYLLAFNIGSVFFATYGVCLYMRENWGEIMLIIEAIIPILWGVLALLKEYGFLCNKTKIYKLTIELESICKSSKVLDLRIMVDLRTLVLLCKVSIRMLCLLSLA